MAHSQTIMGHEEDGWTRREFLYALAGGVVLASGILTGRWYFRPALQSDTFVTKANEYGGNLSGLMVEGFRELGVAPEEIRGKRILLKPNLVETSRGAPHINTHPLVLRGAIEAFLSLGAATVMVGEGPGHRRDTLAVYEESGLADVLTEDRIRFHDLNYITGYELPNAGRQPS